MACPIRSAGGRGCSYRVIELLRSTGTPCDHWPRENGLLDPVARWLDDTIGGRGIAQFRVDRPTTGSNSRAWVMKVASHWQSDARVSPLPLLENERAHV